MDFTCAWAILSQALASTVINDNPGGKAKALTLSYDDGMRQDLRIWAEVRLMLLS